jgi:hypothetical protein
MKKMKKVIQTIKNQLMSLTLIASLGFIGCTQDERNFDAPGIEGAIAFRTQGGTSSLRASVTQSASDIYSFGVSGIWHEEGYDNDKVLLEHVRVYRNQYGLWEYNPTAFYPTEGTAPGTADYVKFYAYSPLLSQESLSEISYENETENQKDLLVAYEKVERANYDQAVSLKFRHALSRVLVAAQNLTNSPVVITEMYLVDLYRSGNLSLEGNTEENGPSNGIPASGESWTYKENPGSTNDYVILWEDCENKTSYPFSLPASGINVSKELQQVVSLNEGVFVIPQTTDKSSFHLRVTYIVGGEEKTSEVHFSDINGLDAGLTFEIGRQYVLRLIFSTEVGGVINIGAEVRFDDIDMDDYDNTVNAPPSSIWAKSNIYFKADTEGGNIGTLTFFEEPTDEEKQRYQGVYFKWGSLIGISPNSTNSSSDYAWHGDDVVFIPEITNDNQYTGKYLKKTISDASSLLSGTGYGNIPVPEFTKEAVGEKNSVLLYNIEFSPSVDNNKYTGDICKFLSTYATEPALKYNWRVPSLREFGPEFAKIVNGKYDPIEWFSYDGEWVDGETQLDPGTNVDGTSTLNQWIKYTYPSTGEDIIFPASGSRTNNGGLWADYLVGAYPNSTLFYDSQIETYSFSFYKEGLIVGNTEGGGISSQSLPVRCIRVQ